MDISTGVRSHLEKQDENENDGGSDDDETTLGRAGGAKFGPLSVAMLGVFADLVASKLVVDETAKGNGISAELESGDGGLVVDGGDGDEHDILEDTAESKNQRRGFADL